MTTKRSAATPVPPRGRRFAAVLLASTVVGGALTACGGSAQGVEVSGTVAKSVGKDAGRSAGPRGSPGARARPWPRDRPATPT